MKRGFWRERWTERRTGFHREEVNDGLLRFSSTVFGNGGRRILVPLCGKSVDLDWLVDQGFDVVGVEFVPEAVEQLAERLGEPSQVTEKPGDFKQWKWGDRFTILQGDVFRLEEVGLPLFDGIWDRAAVVALEPGTRHRYAEVLRAMLRPNGVILMRTFHYDQQLMSGPPFAVSEQCVREELFAAADIETLEMNRTDPDPKFEERGLSWQQVNTFAIRP